MAASISLGSSNLQTLAAAPGAGGVAVERRALNQMQVEGIDLANLIASTGVGGNVNTTG